MVTYYCLIARTLIWSAEEHFNTCKQSIDLSIGHLLATFLCRALAFSSSCLNPFSLYWLSRSFRSHFSHLQLCCFCPASICQSCCSQQLRQGASPESGTTSATRTSLPLTVVKKHAEDEASGQADGE
ncbi:hypothetical protein AAFF_G00018270 [Aldrovandia affinis]|uniref:G-protein coupled receptors family 1 profile domain-containing protein n=1 Tax=Aldrovandia affinis TaxID=143900 RepID=A0AAD7WGR6_9TELE|nr:hypothetical protein AAFF_G00018270 [Aldrovandia affinis]